MQQLAEVVNSAVNASDAYYCKACDIALLVHESYLTCSRCHERYPIEDGIPVFASKRGYWCNVDRDKMRELIAKSERTGDWLNAVNQLIPKYAPAVVPLYRADAQFLFPINKDSRVLDAGSMWGGLTVPIAQYAKTVYAVDQTWETLRFLQTRAKQMGLNNIIPVESSIHHLPFPDDFFDFVVLNGVLEWLGMEQEVVLEKHWNHKRDDQHDYKASPRAMQLAALKELHRVIKPGGGIYIAIENRLGLQYFVGHPDDHMNVRFVTFMPRFIAHWVTKLVRNTDYRTYIYTPRQLQQLVREADLQPKQLYAAYPHYGKISRLTPFNIFSHLGGIAKEGYSHIKVLALSTLWKCIPEPFGKHFSPSLALLAAKSHFSLPQRLIQILVQQSLLPADRLQDYELVLFNNRFGNGHTTNYLVYHVTHKQPIYFCKISRDQRAIALTNESAQLQAAIHDVQQTELANTIPDVLFAGTVDGITLQVARFVSVKSVINTIANGLRCLPRFVGQHPPLIQFPVTILQRVGRQQWLRQINPSMEKGIAWLARFQQLTKSGSVKLRETAEQWLTQQLTAIERNGIQTTVCRKQLTLLRQRLTGVNAEALPIVMQHGDFDLCNLLMTRQGNIFIVDFEHAQKQALPFFDLANLLFSSLVTEWKLTDRAKSLADYAQHTGWQTAIKRWIASYVRQSGIDRTWLQLLPQLAALEQNAKTYPDYRDPYDYPLYGQESFEAMMGWDLCNQ